MYLKLRIIFTILSAICLAALLPAFALGGWLWGAIFGGSALAFYFAMTYFKNLQEMQETKNQPPEADFITNPNSKETDLPNDTPSFTTPQTNENDRNL